MERRIEIAELMRKKPCAYGSVYGRNVLSSIEKEISIVNDAILIMNVLHRSCLKITNVYSSFIYR